MYTKIIGEQQVQILSPNFSISPSNEDYVLNISANGRDFSPLFAVSAGVTRLVSNVAPGSYYKLVGNRSEVVINWQRMCATDGGSFDPTVLDPYWTSAQTVDYVDGVVASGINLDAYWTSAETQSAITAVEDHLFDVEQVTASALTELHDGLLEVSARTVDLSGFWTSAETQDAIDEAISGFTPSANSPIIPAITTQAEYEAISGDVKTGDLIEVEGVVLDGYDEPQYGLFGAYAEEVEEEGVMRKFISWGRRDSTNSIEWSNEDYPWMVDNDVNPIELPGNGFLISPDMTAEDEEYNGIGFNADGKPVTTHIVPQYDEQTGEVTGMTREDRDILGELDEVVADVNEAFSAISETQQVAAAGLNQLEGRIDELSAATPSVDLSGYYTSAQTEDAISAATAGKADAANITAGNGVPAWNSQGIITGKTADLNATRWFYVNSEAWAVLSDNAASKTYYIPTTPGNAGDILVSPGDYTAPVWSAVTIPDMSDFWNSAETKTYVDNRIDGYNTASTIAITPTPMTEGYWLDFSEDTSTQNGPEFEMFKTSKANLVVADISSLNESFDYRQPGWGVFLMGFDSADQAYDMQMIVNLPSSASLTPQNYDMDIPFIVGTSPVNRVALEWDNLSTSGYPNYFIYNTDTMVGHFAYDLNINEFVPGVVESDGEITKVKKLTQAQYDAIVVKDPNTFYIIVSN